MSLKNTCNKSLREEEARQPVAVRIAIEKPVSHKLYSFLEVFDPRS
jgi:hypothetical protein